MDKANLTFDPEGQIAAVTQVVTVSFPHWLGSDFTVSVDLLV